MLTTTERILDAAEGLFASNGIAATSLRSITAAAGVNTAAIHYHFGSKAALLDAVVLRRIAPIDQERLKQLEAMETVAGGEAIAIEALLEAFLAPMLTAGLGTGAGIGGGVRRFGDLEARLQIEHDLGTLPRSGTLAKEVRRRFACALCRGRSDLGPDDALERLDHALAAMMHLRVSSNRAGGGSIPLADDLLRARVERMLQFLAAGFRAPAASRAPGASQ